MAFPLLLIACGDDNESNGNEGNGDSDAVPVAFTASIQPETATRVTVNNGWTGLADSQVAISIDGKVKTYHVNDLGEMTSTDPFYWGTEETLTVDAWYPYNNGTKPETLTVSADQSIPANYEKSDYLEVVGATVTPVRSTLVFKHRTAKLVCSVESEYDDAAEVQVSLNGLAGVDAGTTVKTSALLRALVVPQTVPAGTAFVEVNLPLAGMYVYTIEEDLELKAGCQYEVEINVTLQGIEVEFRQSATWSADAESADTVSPEVDKGTAGGWNTGDSETQTGSSGEINTGTNVGGWQNDTETSTGQSGNVTVGNGTEGNKWNAEEETSTTTTEEPDGTSLSGSPTP